MAILQYAEVRKKPKVFRSMTSFDAPEFDEVLKHFVVALDKKYPGKAEGRGRPNVHLQDPAEKLFFILFYYKTYPLQEVQGYLFGMSQERAQALIMDLSEVLKNALSAAGWIPERLPGALKKTLRADLSGTL